MSEDDDPVNNLWRIPGGIPLVMRDDDEEAAADFAEHMRELREREPEPGPDVVLMLVSDGVRSETVRVRMAPGPWPTWTFEVKP